MKLKFGLILYGTFLFSCERQPDQHQPVYSARTFQHDVNSFGYEIYRDSAVVIYQPFIPCVKGKKAFISKTDADKTAKYVVRQLAMGTEKPSLSTRILDSLHIRY